MTKAEKLKRARKVRAYLARFIDLQEKSLREFVRTEHGRDPDYSALNSLLFARTELNNLIADLQRDGYGEREAAA